MRLLLDEMHSHVIGATLNESGHDVVAVVLEPALRGLADGDLLVFASSQRRALVTENVGDYMHLHKWWTAENRAHSGLVFTHPKSFQRAFLAYPGNLITALERLLADPEPDGDSWIVWL